jgi:hypothetical protein
VVQCWSEPEIYHGAGFKLRADARIRVQEPLQVCLDAGAAKFMTSNLPLLTVLGGRSCIILMSFFQYRIALYIAYGSQKFNSIFHR